MRQLAARRRTQPQRASAGKLSMPTMPSPEAAAATPVPWPREVLRFVGVTLGCCLLSYAGLNWSPLPGRPIVNTSAGLALAAVVLWGRPMALAVAFGVFVSRWFWSSANCPHESCLVAAGSLVHGANEALMAVVGAALLRRWLAQPVLLAEPREVVVFFLAAACGPAALAAVLSSIYHATFGGMALANVSVAGLGHWAGGTLGVMVGAPIAWAWLGRPAADWAPRRMPLTLTGILSTALVHVGVVGIADADSKRTQAEFDRSANHAAALLQLELRNALHALQTTQVLFARGREVSRDEFRQVVAQWLQPPGPLQAIGWSECLRHAEIPAFEARAHAEGLESLHVVSATGDGGVRAPRPDEPLVVIRYIEPLAANRLVPGTNSMANPTAGAAIEAALRSGRPAASASFPLRLPDLPPNATELGVVMYQSVAAAGAGACSSTARGLVFATLRLSSLWDRIGASLPAPLTLCAIDRGPNGRRLAGAVGCETTAFARRRVEVFDVGSRPWELHVLDTDRRRGRGTDIVAGLSAVGMAGAALLVAMLLVVTGRARRIEAAVADAQTARRAAEAANLAKSGFLSRMSHELRTPLNAVLGFAQLLEMSNAPPLPEAQRRWASQINQAGRYLLDMISEILDLSRIESDTLQLADDSLALEPLVVDTLALTEQRAGQRGISVRSDVAPGAAWVRGDATRVRQILTNLLSNAVKYNRDGGWIEVRARRVQSRVEIDVRDGGFGMSEAQMAQLFQPFNRLGRERSGVEGTGIGLVICQRLARLMGGELRVSSIVERGSTFTLVLPPGTDSRAPVAAAPRPAVETAPPVGACLMHYIEDNAVNVEIVRGMLVKRAHWELEHSDSGRAALRALLADDARRPDLILLDLHLPDIDGMALLRRLKAEQRTRSIPLIVASADAMDASREAALAAGAIDYLTKPLDFEHLMGALDRCGRARAAGTETAD